MADKVDSADSVTVTIRPSAEHPDILSIEDAMKQVLDFFDLLVPDDQEPNRLIWKLEVASTNSPLTVTGSPASLDPTVDVSVIARTQRAVVADQLRSIATGVSPRRPLSRQKMDAARRLFQRNMNGIGMTEAVLDQEPILITPRTAEAAIQSLTQASDVDEGLFTRSGRVREEIGSIEGVLLSVGTEYNQPAILVRERRTGRDVWCRVSADLEHRISKESSYEDVWDHRRVLVRGAVRYDAAGAIARVLASSVTVLKPRHMTPHDIRDPNFTDGLSPEAYVERLREGEIGD